MSEAPRGRGTGLNPMNRFEEISYEWEESADPAEKPAPKTRFFKDNTKSILVKNDSPDIPFTWSLNPYRGCEHGCVYCLAGDTEILMADGSTRPLESLRVGDDIIGTARRGFYRRYQRTKVLAHWKTMKAAYRITLEDGTSITSSADHRFLTERGWKHAARVPGSPQRPCLTVNNKLMGFGKIDSTAPGDDSEEFRRGYLCGMIRGDGHLGFYPYKREGRINGHQYRFRLALIAWPDSQTPQWSRGFLAGIFDAEGSFADGIIRIANSDENILAHVQGGLEKLDFDFIRESPFRSKGKQVHYVRVRGGLREHLRFMRMVAPAISRKRDIEGQAVKSEAKLRVVSIEPLGYEMPMFDITTGTEDFIANGVVSHNCYARPYHEYLGLSSGLDFESMIFVKGDAPRLLAEELSKPAWEPDWIALGGVTDCYQPVERKLEITRKCLQVLADARHPCGLVTKNKLVARDVDVFQELAKYGCGRVYVSLTTLDRDLARRMEPRASTPQDRLAAMRTLAKAGVPVGVMTAPMILGLNDHEMPKLLEAAADAGADSAGYVPLRLPHQLGTLFDDWLKENYPDRREKVLNQIKNIRGGGLNDPRFGSRMRGEGIFAEHLAKLFALTCKKLGLNRRRYARETSHFRRPMTGGQLRLI